MVSSVQSKATPHLSPGAPSAKQEKELIRKLNSLESSKESVKNLDKYKVCVMCDGGVSAHPIVHTPYTICRVPYTIRRTPYTIRHTSYVIHHTPYAIHHTPYTIHHTQEMKEQLVQAKSAELTELNRITDERKALEASLTVCVYGVWCMV